MKGQPLGGKRGWAVTTPRRDDDQREGSKERENHHRAGAWGEKKSHTPLRLASVPILGMTMLYHSASIARVVAIRGFVPAVEMDIKHARRAGGLQHELESSAYRRHWTRDDTVWAGQRSVTRRSAVA